MSTEFSQRLNLILPRITDETFLSSTGIGNEIACYIFDYPATEEQAVRIHINFILQRLASHHSTLNVQHLDLLDVVLACLKHRRLYEKVLQKDEANDAAALLGALKGPIAAEKVCDFIAQEYEPSACDLVLLTGVGSVWPMLRAHSLLNCMHTILGTTPLVMFYPGRFDGTTLRLFDQIETSTPRPGARAYYRAFPLISEDDEGTQYAD